MNINAPFIKVSTDGDAGKSIFVSNDSFIGTHSHALIGNNANEFTSLLLNNLLPKFKKGTTIKSSQYSKYKDEIISIPSSHNELSKKIEQLNKWQIKVEETVKQMEEYIEGILQISLK